MPDNQFLLVSAQIHKLGGEMKSCLPLIERRHPTAADLDEVSARMGASAGVFHGGLSGVAFAGDVGLLSRVTQGAQPVGAERTITAADGNLVLALDGQSALDVLLQERGISLDQPAQAMPKLRVISVGRVSSMPYR